MKVLKNGLAMVHALLGFVQAQLTRASGAVLGVRLVDGEGSHWLAAHATSEPQPAAVQTYDHAPA